MYQTKEQIQHIEQRSIAVYNPQEGPRSLPFEMDRTVFQKTPKERQELKKIQNVFKRTGLFKWNEMNRPGNNKN